MENTVLWLFFTRIVAVPRSVLQAGNAIGNGRNLQELRFTSNSSSAGAAIPTVTLDLIIQKLLVVSAVYPFISKTNIKGNLRVPIESTSDDAAWTAESTTVSAGNDSLGSLSLGGYDLIKLVKVSRVVEQLAVDAFEAYIVEKLFAKLMVAIENAILNGTGSANNMPLGILNAITWGSGNQIIYGPAGATLSSLTYDNLTQAKALLPTPYHPGAMWIMNSNTLYSGVCAIKDAVGRPIFLETPQLSLSVASNGQAEYTRSSIAGQVLGSPVIMTPYLADGVILLADLRFYSFNISADALIEKSSLGPGFASNDVYYKGWLLGDGGVSQAEAFVKMVPHN
jgi:HK97 family phage major capsid protein